MWTVDGEAHEIDYWDMLIAFPPCTYLTNAGARWLFQNGKLNEDRYKRGLNAKAFFMNFYNAGVEKIAIENPIASSIFGLPKYSQIIQPYQYGHPVSKKTCLWLKGLPLLNPTNIVEKDQPRRFKQKNGKYRNSCWEMDCRGANRAITRSKTFQGIAQAMAEQWGGNKK